VLRLRTGSDHATTRRRKRLAAVVLTGFGLACLASGILAPTLAPDRPPVPVPTATPTRLPATGIFGGTVALYGRPAANVPTPGQLGCRLITGSGTPAGVDQFSAGNAVALDRLVIDQVAVLPLFTVEDAPDSATVACSSAATDDTQPLYLVATQGRRDLVPMAAYSLATLALVLGIAGVITQRPLD